MKWECRYLLQEVIYFVYIYLEVQLMDDMLIIYLTCDESPYFS